MAQASIKKNTVYNIVKTASSILFPLITFPYISRVLQPENVGKINFGNSIVSYFSLIATLGVTTYAIRECAKVKNDRQRLSETAGQILSINLVTTAIAYALLIVLLACYGKIRDYRLLIAIQSLTIVCTTIGADWLNMAMEDFQYITIRTVIFQVISLILMFTLVRKPEDYIVYAVITVVSNSGANIVNAFYRKKYCRVRITLHCDFRRHLPPILGLFAMLVAQQIFTMCDTTIIGLKLGDYEVGIYSTALKIYNVINQMIGSILWVVMPQLSVAYTEKNISEIRRIQLYVLQFSAVFGLPCIVGMLVYSQDIVLIAGGELYIAASTVIRLLAITLAVQLAGNFFMNVNLLAAGKDRACLIICAVASIVNIITNYVFIPIYGINAAAVTTIVSQSIIVLGCIPFLDKELQVQGMLKKVKQPLAAAVGLTAVAVLIQRFVNGMTVRIGLFLVLGAMVYFGILLLLKNEFVMKIENNLLSKLKRKNIDRSIDK